MTLQAWTIAPGSVPDDQIPQYSYKIAKDTRGAFSVMNPGNSGWSITYLVGWDSAPAISSSTADVSTNNLLNFLSDVLGYAYVDGSMNLHRILPQAHPDVPQLWAVNAPFEGVGTGKTSSSGSITYPTAKVTVEYKSLDFNLVDDLNNDGLPETNRFVTRGFGLDSQYLTVNGMMRFGTGITVASTSSTSGGFVGGPLVAAQPGKITNAFAVDYTWHSVPALTSNIWIPPNFKAINACAGCVNSTIFDPYGINAPVGTMLFLGLDPKQQLPSLGGTDAAGFLSNGGLYYWEIVLKFLYRNNGVYSTASCGHSTFNCPAPGPAGNAALNGIPIGHNFIYRTYGQNATGPQLVLPFWDLVTAKPTPITSADVIATFPNAGVITAPCIYPYQDLNMLFTITG